MLLSTNDVPEQDLGKGMRGGGARAHANYNALAPQTEEAVKNFFTDVYDVWLKTVMSPFYNLDQDITSPVFRQRVAAAARKYL